MKHALLSNLFSRSLLSRFILIPVFLTLFGLSSMGHAVEKSIQTEAEQLKKEVIDLNRELFKLEEELLFPTNTQFTIFLSVDPKSRFVVDSVEVQLDGKMATSYLYRESETIALAKGGVQRLYVGNLASGPHKIIANLNGQGSNKRYFKRNKIFTFDKDNKAKYIELIITESGVTAEPVFKIKEW